MKAKIHPKWNQANVVCACGNTFTVGSTVPEIRVEICAACHPFYTGQMKYIDTKGRVDAFISKKAKASTNALSKTARRAAKKAKKMAEDSTRPETLSELRKMMDL